MTGEAVALELRPAAIPSRLLAAVVDGVLQVVLFLVPATLEGALAPTMSAAASAAITLTLYVLVVAGYPVVCETLLRGRTPGKMLLGLRVVRDDGGPVGFRQSLVRALAGLVLERPGITFGVAALVTMALNGHGKRIGDLLAGTVVMQERVGVRGGPVAVMPPELRAWAASTDLSRLTDDLALSARQLLARSSAMTPAAREDLGGRLVAAVLAVVTPPPPLGTPGWAVLSAVLAERRRRDETRLAGAAAPPVWGPRPDVGPRPPYGAGPVVGPAPAVGPGPYVGPPPTVEPEPPVPPIGTPPAPGPGGFVVPS